MMTAKIEDFLPHSQGLEKISLTYRNGAWVDIVPGCRIYIKYNTGDTILYVYQDGEYVMDLIATHDGRVVLASEEKSFDVGGGK